VVVVLVPPVLAGGEVAPVAPLVLGAPVVPVVPELVGALGAGVAGGGAVAGAADPELPPSSVLTVRKFTPASWAACSSWTTSDGTSESFGTALPSRTIDVKAAGYACLSCANWSASWRAAASDCSEVATWASSFFSSLRFGLIAMNQNAASRPRAARAPRIVLSRVVTVRLPR
jgi:hypothetical protein